MSAEQRPVSAITIRRAELTDAPVLATLMEELGYQTRTSEMEMRLQPIFATNKIKYK